MSNLITAEFDRSLQPVSMSNGMTDVFVSVLALAGSALAEDDEQVELVVWLCAHDQAVVGGGCVGFDVQELPWRMGRMAEQKAFLERVIDGATGRRGWEKLDYEPREDWVIDILRAFGRLLEAVPVTVARDRPDGDPWGLIRRDRARCPKHDVFLHAHGCVVCNDGQLAPVAPGSQ